MKKFFLIITSLLGLAFQSQASTDIDSFLNALKKFDYDKSKHLAEKLNSEDNVKHGKELIDVLYYAGQNKEITIDSFVNPNYSNFTKALINLKIGYYNLFQNSYSSNPFKNFSISYNLALEDNNIELQKLCLFAILEVFNFELVAIGKEYDIYIEKLEEIATEEIDFIRIQLVKVELIHDKTKSKQDDSIYFELDSLYKVEKFNETITAKYNFIKGYQRELEKKYNSAEQKFKNVLAFSQKKPFLKSLKFGAFIRLAEINRKKKFLREAKSSIDSARKYINLSNPEKSNYVIDIYSSKINYDLGNYKKAYEENYRSAVFSLINETNENSREIAQLSLLYETEKKEKDLLISNQEKARNRNIAIGLGGSLAAVSIIAFLVFKNTKRKQRIAEQERELEIKKKEKILKEQELTTIDAMIAGQEKERQRLASDLHDSVGATLAAAKMQFEHLSQNKAKAIELEDVYNKTGKLLEDAYTEVRSMAHIKNSGVLAKNGLLPAVEKLAKNASGVNNLSIDIQHFGLEERIESSLEISIFRIIQELVTNIIKHSKATEANISITQHEDSINLIVEDNGVGFNSKNIEFNKGMGLSSIEKRIEHLEGSFEVDATKGKGTTILIDIPL